jgi:parvulin-like peptidyl-prolyl isomerase
MSFDLLEDKLITDILWNKLIYATYKNNVKIDPNEVVERLNEIQSKTTIDEYLLYEILLDPVPTSKVEETINKIKNKIKTNGFEKVALEFSIADSAHLGGKLGWIKDTEISQKYKNLIKKTPIGSLAEPIVSPRGILILRVNEKRQKKIRTDPERQKELLVNEQKNRQLNMFSTMHFNRLKNATTITSH